MSIELMDDNGELGQLATNQGHRDFIAWVEKNGDEWEALQEFADQGECDDVGALAADAKAAANECDEPNVKSVLENLAGLLQKAEGTVIAE